MLAQARGDVLTCLVTGNLEPIGWGKMRALGLHDFFSEPPFGGFGSDTCSGNIAESWKDRAELVRIAAARARDRCSGMYRLLYIHVNFQRLAAIPTTVLSLSHQSRVKLVMLAFANAHVLRKYTYLQRKTLMR